MNKESSLESDWLNINEAANYLRIIKKDGSPCAQSLRNLVNKKRIPYYKPYGRLLFKKDDLKRLVETTRKGGFNWR